MWCGAYVRCSALPLMRGTRPYIDRPRGAVPYLRQARPMCGVVRCLRVSSTGLGLTYLLCVVPGLTSYVFPRQAPGSPQILRQAPPMSGARGAWPYLLCVVQCPALLLMCGALPRQAPLMCGDRPYLLCVVPGFTFDTPAYVQCPGCFALLMSGALLRHPRFALLCFDRARGASTGPAYLLCALRCFAYFDSPWPCLRQPPLCFASTPPGGALLACFVLLALRAYLLAYVFPTHTEGGDPGSLHEKKIKTKEF